MVDGVINGLAKLAADLLEIATLVESGVVDDEDAGSLPVRIDDARELSAEVLYGNLRQRVSEHLNGGNRCPDTLRHLASDVEAMARVEFCEVVYWVADILRRYDPKALPTVASILGSHGELEAIAADFHDSERVEVLETVSDLEDHLEGALNCLNSYASTILTPDVASGVSVELNLIHAAVKGAVKRGDRDDPAWPSEHYKGLLRRLGENHLTRLKQLIYLMVGEDDPEHGSKNSTDDRTRVFQEWRQGENLGPAKIRDRWNSLSDEDRKRLAPGCWQRINAKDAGRELVKKALSRWKNGN
ncbi:MAG: hypothetical protein GXX96_37970 [Planctomycetaceae bacterium]|nr:hypothetical protein [Planctomycetaceae bacterium]